MHGLPPWLRTIGFAAVGIAAMTVLVPGISLVRETGAYDWYATGKLTLEEIKLAIGFREFTKIEYRTPDGRTRTMGRYAYVTYGPAIWDREQLFALIGDRAILGAGSGLGAAVLYLALYGFTGRWRRHPTGPRRTGRRRVRFSLPGPDGKRPPGNLQRAALFRRAGTRRPRWRRMADPAGMPPPRRRGPKRPRAPEIPLRLYPRRLNAAAHAPPQSRDRSWPKKRQANRRAPARMSATAHRTGARRNRARTSTDGRFDQRRGLPSQGVSYYERDGYYAKDAPEHREASAWTGKGATALGLSGPVDPGAFRAILEGYVPGGPRLGRPGKDGGIVHRPGRDLTLSAPKSVSWTPAWVEDRVIENAHEGSGERAHDPRRRPEGDDRRLCPRNFA